MPLEIRRRYRQWWVDEEDEGTKNQYEGELLGEQLKRFGKNIKYSYNKVLNLQAGKKLYEQMSNLMPNKLNVIVYNFGTPAPRWRSSASWPTTRKPTAR